MSAGGVSQRRDRAFGADHTRQKEHITEYDSRGKLYIEC
jgi:hypothetical protein